MTDTRMVRLEQIAAGPSPNEKIADAYHRFAEQGLVRTPCRIYCRRVGDATGGDVFAPEDSLEAGILEGLIRAKWPHPVQVEVING